MGWYKLNSVELCNLAYMTYQKICYNYVMADASTFLQKKCVPCEGGVDPLKGEKLAALLPAVPSWEVVEEERIEKEFTFKNFKEALIFINKVGELAESEGHHPDINLHNYKRVTISLMTHAINGLSENDFIMAVKIDQVNENFHS